MTWCGTGEVPKI